MVDPLEYLLGRPTLYLPGQVQSGCPYSLEVSTGSVRGEHLMSSYSGEDIRCTRTPWMSISNCAAQEVFFLVRIATDGRRWLNTQMTP